MSTDPDDTRPAARAGPVLSDLKEEIDAPFGPRKTTMALCEQARSAGPFRQPVKQVIKSNKVPDPIHVSAPSKPTKLFTDAQTFHWGGNDYATPTKVVQKKFAVLSACEQYNLPDLRRLLGQLFQDSLCPRTPFRHGHRIQRSVVGMNDLARRDKSVFSGQNEPLRAEALDQVAHLPEPGGYIEVPGGCWRCSFFCDARHEKQRISR